MQVINNRTQNDLIRKQACPMTASINWDPEKDSTEEKVAFFREYKRLPIEIGDGLLNDVIADTILELAERYNINDYRKIGEISRIVREVFMKNIREDEIKNRLTGKLGLNDYDSDHMLIDLKHVIQLVRTVGIEEVQRATDFLPVMDAIKKYPQIANMEIGNISLENSSEEAFAEPTTRNWLEDYFSHVGTGKHDSLTRSEYLFNGKNAKKLDSTDREKLAIILKSYDTGEPLMIDRETKEVLFQAQDNEKAVAPREIRGATASVNTQAAGEGDEGRTGNDSDNDFRKKWNGQSSLGDKVEEFFSNQEKESLPPDVKSMTFEPGLNVMKPKVSSWDREKEELARQKEKFQTRFQVASAAQAQRGEEPKKEEIIRLEEKPQKRPERNVVDLNEYL